ncbi:MAG: MFS transporter, partial [Planctomycetota bacterium]
GRRSTLVLLTLGTLAGSILWALAPQLEWIAITALVWLSLSRFVTGVFSSQAAVAFAVASDTVSGESRSVAFGVIGAAFGLAFTIGPALGGLTAEWASYASVGWVMAGCQVLSLLTVFLLMQDVNRCRATSPKATQPECLARTEAQGVDHSTSTSEASLASPVLASGTSKTFTPRIRMRGGVSSPIAVAIAVTGLLTAAQAILIPTIQPVLETRFGGGPAQAGLFLAVLGLIGVFVQGGAIRPLRKRAREDTIALAGAVFLIAGFLMLAFESSIAIFAIGVSAIAIGASLAGPTVTAIGSNAVDEARQGAVHGTLQSATSVGRVIGFIAGPAVYTAVGVMPTFGLAAALSAGGLIALIVHRHSNLHASSSATAATASSSEGSSS